MPSDILVLGLTAAGALLVGVLLGSVIFRGGRLRRKIEALEDEMQRAAATHREAVRNASRLRADTETYSRFLIHMPDFARQINQDQTRRNVYRFLAEVLQRLFEPQQVMIFTTDRRGQALRLEEARGLPDDMAEGREIRLGGGRLGWVAAHQMAMAGEDFLAQSRVGHRPLDAEHPGLLVDLAAPLVHDERLLGVIAVGGMDRHPRGEKQMIKMAADLGTVALHNAELFESIRRAANHDGLTGLANKRYFMQRLGIIINEAETTNRPLAVFIFDIDHFKSYNDQNGHLAGDEVLKRVGRIFRESLREEDLPARYGGEEFIAVLPNTDRQGGQVVAEKVRSAIETFSFANELNQPSGNLTVSGGVAAFPLDGRSSTDLIAHADQALYAAKAQGRNRIIVFQSPDLGDDAGDLIEKFGM